jgi:hypothetical protein
MMPPKFTKPPTIRELGAATGQSYWSVRRLVKAGVAPVAHFPDGDRIDAAWANRYHDSGLTTEELELYRSAMREHRRSKEASAA